LLPYWPVFWSLIWSPATAHRRTTDDGCTPNSVRDVLAVVSSAGNSWPRWRWEDSGLRGGGAVFPAAPRRAGRRVSGRAAAGRRRARGCARCGLRLGYQLYRIIAVPITYWYLYSITLYPGAGSLFTFAAPMAAPHSAHWSWSGPCSGRRLPPAPRAGRVARLSGPVRAALFRCYADLGMPRRRA